MATATESWKKFFETAYAAADQVRPEAPAQIDECGRCLHPLSEHEFTTDHYGDSVRVCPDDEADWWNLDRERAWRGRREGILP